MNNNKDIKLMLGFILLFLFDLLTIFISGKVCLNSFETLTLPSILFIFIPKILRNLKNISNIIQNTLLINYIKLPENRKNNAHIRVIVKLSIFLYLL